MPRERSTRRSAESARCCTSCSTPAQPFGRVGQRRQQARQDKSNRVDLSPCDAKLCHWSISFGGCFRILRCTTLPHRGLLAGGGSWFHPVEEANQTQERPRALALRCPAQIKGRRPNPPRIRTPLIRPEIPGNGPSPGTGSGLDILLLRGLTACRDTRPARSLRRHFILSGIVSQRPTQPDRPASRPTGDRCGRSWRPMIDC